MSTVAQHMKKRRSELGMTQDNLAEQLFVTRHTVSNWETGRSQPDIDTLVRIAEVLKTDASALIYGPPQEPNRKGALRGLWISGGITLLLGLTYIIGMPMAKKLIKQVITNMPYQLLQLLIVPLFFFVLGWTRLQGLFVAGLLKPLSKERKPLFFVSLGILVIVFLPIIAFSVERIVVFFLKIHYHANPMLYPAGFSYTGVLPNFIYGYCYQTSFVWVRQITPLTSFLLGIALWLTKPRNNTQKGIGSGTEDNLNLTVEK